MAYKFGSREKISFLPNSIEDYVSEEDPVRVYDAFIESINLIQLGIELNENKVGNSEYDPVAMVKLLTYGYSYGIQSSRKLERALNHNLSFIWLTGGLKPDFKTIAEFRRKNKSSLSKILKQCVRLCLKLKLIDGNILFTDGSKLRGNASSAAFYDKERAERHLKRIDLKIDQLLNQIEELDKNEEQSNSLITIDKDLKSKVKLKNKIKSLLPKLEKGASINLTDNNVKNMKGRQGTHASYNVQVSTDEKHGLIVSDDVVSDANDKSQLYKQVKNSEKNLGKKISKSIADAGYANTEELKKIFEEGVDVIVPSQKQALKKPIDSPFSKEKFIYNEENDTYICPEGYKLVHRSTTKENGRKTYQVYHKKDCHKCAHFGICTTNKKGRTITRLKLEKWKEKFESDYLLDKNQKEYKKRKEKVELQFGHFKRNIGIGSFLLRGFDGVKAEMSLLSTSFNLRRMITIIGTKNLIKALKA